MNKSIIKPCTRLLLILLSVAMLSSVMPGATSMGVDENRNISFSTSFENNDNPFLDEAVLPPTFVFDESIYLDIENQQINPEYINIEMS